LILAPEPRDCAELLTWRANCAYLIMWHADCIINFVFHFFLKKLKNLLKLKKKSGFFLLQKIIFKIFKYFEIYIFRKFQNL